MAWTVGIEEIYIGDIAVEGQWEVDADSEESAKNPDLIPYLFIGRLEWADVPYKQIEWVTGSELTGQESIYTGEHDENDEPITVLLDPEQVLELAANMDTISDGVSLADLA